MLANVIFLPNLSLTLSLSLTSSLFHLRFPSPNAPGFRASRLFLWVFLAESSCHARPSIPLLFILLRTYLPLPNLLFCWLSSILPRKEGSGFFSVFLAVPWCYLYLGWASFSDVLVTCALLSIPSRFCPVLWKHCNWGKEKRFWPKEGQGKRARFLSNVTHALSPLQLRARCVFVPLHRRAFTFPPTSCACALPSLSFFCISCVVSLPLLRDRRHDAIIHNMLQMDTHRFK